MNVIGIFNTKRTLSGKAETELHARNALKYIENYLPLYFNNKFKRTNIKVELIEDNITLPPPVSVIMQNAFNFIPADGKPKKTSCIKVRFKNKSKDKIYLYPEYSKYKYNNGELLNISHNDSIQEIILSIFQLINTTKKRTKLYKKQQKLSDFIDQIENESDNKFKMRDHIDI